MSGARPWRVAWLFARSHDGKRPRAQHKDYADHAEAVAHKDRLQCQFGDAVTACVSPMPEPKIKVVARKPPSPIVTEELNSAFWVSVFVPSRNGNPAIVQHHGFADCDRAEARKVELKARGGDAAVCLSSERPPGARLPKGRSNARG